MKYKMTKNIKTIVSLGIIFIIVISLKFNKERENNNLILVDKNITSQEIQTTIKNKIYRRIQLLLWKRKEEQSPFCPSEFSL